MKTKKSPPKPHMIEFEEALWRALKSRAAQEGTSVSGIIRRLAADYLRQPQGRHEARGARPFRLTRSGKPDPA
jgi:hypothetical protein